ncbi:polysaccharide biosynthesis/export family protein [Brevundimonas sp. 2R-24]|uniref:Polysaccharide biosynthesis/export family protein n=1 Tax=Peiella sedimenti TaxID=3061083 RepID=A0ABT8SRQ1_9CAUL|nr:polysaccharide biosynthesis/export family protein [Caulobacteraceae bacterium XZ-24]
MLLGRRQLVLLLAAAPLAACASGGSRMPLPAGHRRPGLLPDFGAEERDRSQGFVDIPFADWSEAEPEYRLYPGDQIDVRLPTATELNQQPRVGPDGRIAMPLIGQVMAADRTLAELQADLSDAYATQLVRPIVEVSLREAGPLKVFVGGEVGQPGVYDMPGDIDALQAVIMAGGFRPSANRGEVALIRRGVGDRRMLRKVDLSGRTPENVALRRFDILYVSRSGLGELAAFMSQIRDALPIGFSYSLNDPYR